MVVYVILKSNRKNRGQMIIAMRYLSRTGHTKQVAEIIAQELGITAKPITEPLSEVTDILVLGGAIYGFSIDDDFKAYIAGLNPTKIKKVYVIATSALVKSVNQTIKDLLLAQGLNVAEDTFHCYGKFAAIHAKHPTAKDLQDAAAFAKKIV
jgi:flavodoxin